MRPNAQVLLVVFAAGGEAVLDIRNDCVICFGETCSAACSVAAKLTAGVAVLALLSERLRFLVKKSLTGIELWLRAKLHVAVAKLKLWQLR